MRKISISKKLIKGVIFGTVCGVLITAILLLLSAVIFLKSGKLPSEILPYITAAFAGIGALAGGFICGRIYRKAGLLCGGVTGFILFLIVFAAGTACMGELTYMAAVRLAVIMLAALLGGVLGVNKREKIRIK